MKKKTPKTKNDLITLLDAFFGNRQNLFFYIALVLIVLFGIYLFDVKISTGGDDSTYLVNAKRFIDGENFPSHLGAGYPLFIAIPMALFGVNVVAFKILSFLFVIGSLVLLFHGFKNRVSTSVLILLTLFISVNSQILYYASQTYSEALYMLLQAACFFIIFRLYDKLKNNNNYLNLWKLWLLYGFVAFYLGVTRMVGYGMMLAIAVFFLTDRNWKASVYSVASFMVFFIPYTLYKKIFWSASQAGRVGNVFYKNVYNKAAGKEDFAGMISRYFDNMEQYLSKHFMIILGLQKDTSTDKSMFWAIVVVALFILSLYYAFKKQHKIMMILGLYLGAAINITFIALQQSWDQQRLILIYVPLIVLFSSYGLLELSKEKGMRFIQFVLIIFLSVIVLKSLGSSINKAQVNKRILAKNMNGNKYYGFTPDWIHFLQMSEWTAKNLPDEAYVGSRKPSMSFIYGKGKSFHPMYKFPVSDANALISSYKQTYPHLITTNLRQAETSLQNPYQQMFLKQNMAGIITQGNDMYSVYGVQNNEQAKSIETLLKTAGVNYYTNIDSFTNMLIKSEKAYYGVSPDSLINKLYEANVEYVIMASLRVNPRQKTNRTINTIRRYIYFTEIKYPGIFTKVHQIGKNEDEPASLYQVNYDKYNIGKN